MNEVIEHDNGIAIPEETKTAMVAMGKIELGISAMLEKYATTPDCSTEDGYKLAKQEAKEVGAVITSANKSHKVGKKFYLDGGREVDAAKNRIIAAIEPMKAARLEAIKEVDDEKARIAQAEADKKQERIDEIQIRIDGIKNSVGAAMSLEACDSYLARLEVLDIAEFEEFQEAAQIHIDNARDGLTERRNGYAKQAEEARLLEEQRAKQAEEQGRIDAEREEQRLEKEKLDEEMAALRREKEELESAKLAEEKRKQDELKAAKEIEDARLLGIQQQKERDEQERKDAEAAEESERVEAEPLAALAPDADKLQAWIDLAPEMTSKEGQKSVSAIKKGALIAIDKMQIREAA